MSFEAARCPSCGATIQVPADREKARCMICGAEVNVQTAINEVRRHISREFPSHTLQQSLSPQSKTAPPIYRSSSSPFIVLGVIVAMIIGVFLLALYWRAGSENRTAHSEFERTTEEWLLDHPGQEPKLPLEDLFRGGYSFHRNANNTVELWRNGQPLGRTAQPDESRMATARKSLAQAKQLSLACKLYAVDHDGDYPPSLEALFPRYITGRQYLASPFAPSQVAGYIYHAGLNDGAEGNAVLLEDRYSNESGVHVVVHLDSHGEIVPSSAH